MNIPKPEQFAAAVEQIKIKRTQLGAAIEVEVEKRGELGRVTDWHTRQGLEGKNQAERDSSLRAHVEKERFALDEAEQEVRSAKLDHELATLELDSLRYQLRAIEAALRLEATA